MKKLVIIFIGIIAIISSVSYAYCMHKAKKGEIQINNSVYSNLYQKELSGNELATIMNKTLDNNEKNNIEKDENGNYINNNNNSINIEIKFKQSDNVFSMETIYKNQISKFIELYGQVKFKCIKLEYHSKTNMIKYLYFEET